MSRVGSWSVMGIATFAVMTIVGCGGGELPRQVVEGAVLFDGRPMKSGMIRFVPDSSTKAPAAVGSIVDGFYVLDQKIGPVAGKYRIEIEGQIESPFDLDDESAYAAAFDKSRQNPLPSQPVPAKYNRNSELSAEVTTDETANKFDFDLRVEESLAGK